MKGRSILVTLGWPLLGLLAVAGMMMALGKRDVKSFPDSTSTGPSGTAVFAEMLRDLGYNVRVDRRPSPRLEKNDVAVAFVVAKQQLWKEYEEEETPNKFPARFRSFIESGGKGLVLFLPENFQAASREVMRSPETRIKRPVDGKSLQITSAYSIHEDLSDLVPDYGNLATSAEAWTSAKGTNALVSTNGKGVQMVLDDGICATNRFIAKADNAVYLATAIRSIAPKGSNIVFTEASFGNARNPSVTSLMGQWASVAWYQLLFCVGVIALSLGRRFGVPEVEFRKQRGSRELVDAVAMTYRRSKSGKVALQAALNDCDARIRDHWRMPKDASRSERDRYLPEPLYIAWNVAETAVRGPEMTQKAALQYATNLQKCLAKAMAGDYANQANPPAELQRSTGPSLL